MNEPRYTGKATDFSISHPTRSRRSLIWRSTNKRPDLGRGRARLRQDHAGCTQSLRRRSLVRWLRFSVKSTSRAQDLLYRLNALRRLQDAQNPNNPQAQYVYPYLSLGPLGAAIHRKKSCLVLIDEVDKADIDFPATCSTCSIDSSIRSMNCRRPRSSSA